MLFSVAQIRQIEAEFATTQPQDSLMQRAGDATARYAEEFLDGKGGRILVLAGTGNNGGDAWVAARRLQQSWHRVTVVIESETAEKSLARQAQTARKEFLSAQGRLVTAWPEDETHDLILDGLLGIGITRAVTGKMAALIARANASGVPICAIDIPSGLSADTGAVMGSTMGNAMGNRLGEAIRARNTITFIGAKPGMYTGDGRDHCGEIRIDTLGVDTSLRQSNNSLLTPEGVAGMAPARVHNSHKGQFGTVGVLGGAQGMLGAAVLAARAALHLGAGKIFLAPLADDAPGFDPLHPEIMLKKARDLVARETLESLVVGPGMGTGDAARNMLAAALKANVPLVLDADALNLIADGRALQNQLLRRTAPHLLTPHPGEAARLLQASTSEIQADRIKAACTLATRFNALVVLKGSGSVIAFPDTTWHINSTGNPGMASGGMGDALAGMLGALLAQGLAPEEALMLGTCLHGAAADRALEQHCGPIGLTASEVIFAAREVLNEWSSPTAHSRDADSHHAH